MNLPMRLVRRIPVIALALIAACPAIAADPDPGMLSRQSYDQRLLSIGYRLQSHAGDLCDRPVPLTGVQVHDASLYAKGDQQAARDTFGFGEWPVVLAVAPDSAAARAGLVAGDAIVAIDGAPVSTSGKGQFNSYVRTEAVTTQLEEGAADGALDLLISRGGTQEQVHVVPDIGCASRFQTRVSKSFTAEADGAYVEVTTGAMDYLTDDSELAGVVAHELAHNILHHTERLDRAGIKRGLLQFFGRNARLTRETETEADRLVPYLFDRAGYPVESAALYLERYRKAYGMGIFTAPTHPREGTRIKSIEREIANLAALKAAGKPVRPDYIADQGLPTLD